MAIRIIAAPTPVVRTLRSARCGVNAFMPVLF
jgi:hypothetical protein